MYIEKDEFMVFPVHSIIGLFVIFFQSMFLISLNNSEKVDFHYPLYIYLYERYSSKYPLSQCQSLPKVPT